MKTLKDGTFFVSQKSLISVGIMLVFGILLLNIALASANGDHQNEIAEGKKLMESDISCDELSGEQLEAIGEYLMEQMHPGEAHEAMHKMMGIEEGTEYHKQVHINMARMMYCGEAGMMSSGMMGSGDTMGMMPMMMNMMRGGNMMGSGDMMNMVDGQTPQTNMMQGMMGNNPIGFSYGYWWFWGIIWLLFWIGIIVLIIWFIHKFIVKKTTSETPVEILKKRFAKGEISKRQFESMKKEVS